MTIEGRPLDCRSRLPALELADERSEDASCSVAHLHRVTTVGCPMQA